MERLLLWLVTFVARIHNKLLSLNDSYQMYFTDKQLHFLVMGAIGMLFVFIIYPFFKALAENHKYMTLTGIYVFTIMVVLTFAIEIGQGISHTGNMEMQDVVWGLAGFLLMFLIWCVIRAIYHLIRDR